MNKLALGFIAIMASVSAHAATISSSTESVAPSSISQISLLETTNNEKVQLIISDRGMSTDIVPRYTVHLGYSSLNKVGNITADFKLTDRVYQYASSRRLSPGRYEVILIEVREGIPMKVNLVINFNQVYTDEKNMRQQCGDNFCDKILDTTISVTETVSPQ
ncbi:hypothetical protein D3C87_104070 [compost metagenome]